MNLVKQFSKVVLGTFLAVLFAAFSSSVVFAGTDLVVNCASIGACSITPNNTPLFNEAGWIPGTSATQFIQVTDSAAENGFVGLEVINYAETASLGAQISIDIYRGVPLLDNSNRVYGGVTLHQFRDDGFFTIDGINSGQTKNYYVVATMVDSGVPQNQYQGAMVEFDLNMGLQLTPIPPDSNGGDGEGNSSSDGSGGPASPPVCHDDVPTTAPSVTITNVGTNTVTLTWTAVSPVSHYALIFTRTSDGEQYGSTNIGNVTEFTVTNLSGGANYSFEVFGVNGCAPGPRGTAGSGTVPGPFIGGRPLGGGQVLGDDTTEEEDEETEQAAEETDQQSEDEDAGLVAGAVDDQCQPWRFYVPWILLVSQGLLVLVNEYYFKKDHGLTKHFVTIGITLASIFLFYLLRSCPCYESGSLWILVWLCTWYWLVAAAGTIGLRLISYAFIEEVEETKVTPVAGTGKDLDDTK
jgi:hypothetical protein